MDNITPATAQEFVTNYGVAPDVAADLARQANAISGRNGFAAQAEVAHGVDNYVPPAPSPAPAYQGNPTTARTEYDQLMTDRAEGKISNFQWNDPAAIARRDALVATIAGVPPAKPSVQELTDAARAHDQTPLNATFDAHFAPPASPSDYRTTHLETPSEETAAADLQLREAVHADRVPASLFTTIDSDLVAAQRRQETLQQRDARIEAEDTRTKAMWGGQLDENIAIIREAVDKVSERTREAFKAAWPLLSPNSRDQVLQWAKYRTGRL